MTRPKVSRYPVSSFGPELMTILLKGARGRVEIPCPDQRTMKYLQMRLQMLRGAMARERHPNYTLVTRARTSRLWNTAEGPDSGCVLVVQPNDAQFTKLIADAGIAAPEDTGGDILADIDGGTAPIVMDLPKDLSPLKTDEDPYAKFKGD
jgi:hypothetical protein